MSGKNLALQLWSKTLSTNQIEAFFDHQHLWKPSILGILHGDSHQRKGGSETTPFGLMQSVVPLIQSDCRIL